MNTWYSVGGIAAFVVLLVPMASAGIILRVLPATQTVGLGSSVGIGIGLSGLGDPPSVGTFDISVGFDDTILSFIGASFGDPVLGDQLDPTGEGNTLSFVNPGFDTVDLFELSLDTSDILNSLQARSFILATLSFNTVAAGSSSLGVNVDALGDADGNSLSAGILSGAVSVSCIPEPAPLLLLAVGMFLILLLCQLQSWNSHFVILGRLRPVRLRKTVDRGISSG
jgi:hypothetical protein